MVLLASCPSDGSMFRYSSFLFQGLLVKSTEIWFPLNFKKFLWTLTIYGTLLGMNILFSFSVSCPQDKMSQNLLPTSIEEWRGTKPFLTSQTSNTGLNPSGRTTAFWEKTLTKYSLESIVRFGGSNFRMASLRVFSATLELFKPFLQTFSIQILDLFKNLIIGLNFKSEKTPQF